MSGSDKYAIVACVGLALAIAGSFCSALLVDITGESYPTTAAWFLAFAWALPCAGVVWFMAGLHLMSTAMAVEKKQKEHGNEGE